MKKNFYEPALVLLASFVVSLTCTFGTLFVNSEKNIDDSPLTIHDSSVQECDATMFNNITAAGLIMNYSKC